ncbi:ABC transporter permease [Nocardia altamirensis]|uniref:ABC transporter permease n=1 Tax=Nocardia altamirensis TaxID=472158 RepID=UPI000840089D|nr:ABC transporter permease [Nocardia altamirensis]
MNTTLTAHATVAGHPRELTTTRVGEVDNLATYVSFGAAYLLGHGAAALSKGDDPFVSLPGWLPLALLGGGLAVGIGYSIRAANRAQRGASTADILSGKLLGFSWASAFVALFLAITGLAAVVEHPDLQTMLWPVGSGLIVGLLYLGEGAVRRNVLHYALGTWLALTSTAALFFGATGLFWVLAIAGGGGYLVASVLERRRLAVA